MKPAYFKSKKVNFHKKILVLSFLFLASCTSTKLDNYDKFMAKAEYAEAKKYALDTDDELLWTLQAAAAARAEGAFDESNKLFDKAEFFFKQARKKNAAEEVASGIGQVVFSDASLAYRGEVHDGIMINLYKALNFMELKAWDDARVELNRAYDRQRRAADFYADEIREQEEELGDKADSIDVEKLLDNPKFKDIHNVKAYGDYVNPMVNLIEIIYLSHRGTNGDKERIKQSLDRLVSMTSSHHMAKDFSTIKEKTWLIIENGQGPRKEEYRIDIPLEFFTGIKEIKYTGIAIPFLRSVGSESYDFQANDENLDLITDMDRVIHAEFDRALKGIVLRAVTALVLKSVAQYAAFKAGGDHAAWLVAGFQALTTHADIRVWSALPKNFHLALVESGKIDLKAQGLSLSSFTTKGNKIIYVKLSKQGRLNHHIIDLD